MNEPERSLNHSLIKAHPIEIFSSPLESLIDICGSIETPSFDDLKGMLLNYKKIEGDIWFSVFVCEWNEFYGLPELIKTVIKKHQGANPKLAELCSEVLSIVESCRDEIDTALDSKPNLANIESHKIEESFYNSMVKPCYRRLRRICNDLRMTYSPKLSNYHTIMAYPQKDVSGESDLSLTIIDFMKHYCKPQSDRLLNSRKKSLQKAHQNTIIKLPNLARPWIRGQAKHYKPFDLISNWKKYCHKLPNLPHLKN